MKYTDLIFIELPQNEWLRCQLLSSERHVTDKYLIRKYCIAEKQMKYQRNGIIQVAALNQTIWKIGNVLIG